LNLWDLNFSYVTNDKDFTLNINHKWTSKITGICGHSGSGKSTLLEILLGLRPTTNLTGHAKLGNQTIFDNSHFPPTADRGITWVPQQNTLFPFMSIKQNLVFATNDAKKIRIICEELEISDFLDKFPRELSGGQRQRIALARALLTDCNTILLDEPLNALDRQTRKRLLPWLREISQNYDRRFLYVSHDSEEIEALADYELVLENGRLVSTREL